MRILALVFEDVFHPTGGMGVHARDLYREIGRLGHEVRIVTIASEPPAYGIHQLCENVEVLKVEQKLTYQTNTPLLMHFLFEQNFLMNTLEHYGQQHFDIIHVHDSHMWSVAEALRLLWKIPVVLTCHLSPLLHEMRYATDLLAEYKNQVEGTALCNADVRISVSRYYHDALKASLIGVDSTVVHNGVNEDELAQCRRDPALRAHYGATDSTPLVCMVGRPVDNKGVRLFMEAAKWFPDTKFVYIGYLPPTVENHYPLAEELKLAECNNFRWERAISHHDKFRLMASADIGVMPSLFEPFGIAALEWMALGVPLITTGVGGLAEFCGDHNCDLMAPTADALVDALMSHQRYPWKLAEARRTASLFTWQKAAERTLEVYKEATCS